jgi:hypothetical protein
MRRVNPEGERTEMAEMTKNAGESGSVVPPIPAPPKPPDAGIRCGCGAGPHPTNPDLCEAGHFWKQNKKQGVSPRRYLAQRAENIEVEVDTFLRDDLGWSNPADAPVDTRKEVRRAVNWDLMYERFLQASKPERADKFAERAATLRERLRTDPRHRPQRGQRAAATGNEPRAESDVAFVRRRLMEVVENGTDAAVVSAARELREQYGLGACAAATTPEAVSHLPLPVIEARIWQLEVQLHPDSGTRPAADILREIVAEAERAAIDIEAIRRAEREAAMRRSAEQKLTTASTPEPQPQIPPPAVVPPSPEQPRPPTRPTTDTPSAVVIEMRKFLNEPRDEPSDADIKTCLTWSGDWVSYESGQLTRAEAVTMTTQWLRSKKGLAR